MTREKFIKAWNHFWFEPQSALTIGLVRIMFGLLFFQFAILILPDLHTLFGTNSIVSIEMAKSYAGNSRTGLLELLPRNDLSLDIPYAVFTISTVLLTLGIFTKVSAVIVYLGFLTLDIRNPYIFGAPDMVLKTVSFLLIFSNCDRALSLDMLRNKWQPVLVSPWALRLIQVYFAFIYWTAFSRKIIGQDWINGTAVYYVAHFWEERRYTPSFIFDNLATCRFLSWSTLLIEFALFSLIWIKEFRLPVIILGIFFHLTMDAALALPLFQFAMIAGLVSFIDPSTLRLCNKHELDSKPLP